MTERDLRPHGGSTEVIARVAVDVATRTGTARRIVVGVPVAIPALQGGRIVARYVDGNGGEGAVCGCSGVLYRHVADGPALAEALDYTRHMTSRHAVTGERAPRIEERPDIPWGDQALVSAHDLSAAEERVEFVRHQVARKLMMVDGRPATPAEMPLWMADPSRGSIVLEGDSWRRAGVSAAYQFGIHRLDDARRFFETLSGRAPEVAGRVVALDPSAAVDDLPWLAAAFAGWVAACAEQDVSVLPRPHVLLWHDMQSAAAGPSIDPEDASRLLRDILTFVEAVQGPGGAGLRCRRDYDQRWQPARIRAMTIEGVVPAADLPSTLNAGQVLFVGGP